MSRGTGLAHIIWQDDRTATGTYGAFSLKSAFQPIFAFEKGALSIVAFEGVIRPFRDGESISPVAFFRSIPAGDRLHVETLTRTLHLLNAGEFLDPSTMLFINFDPSVFSEREVAEPTLRDMRLVLHEAGMDPRRIVCEVTEQKSASQQALGAFVAALRDHGFKIAVDDYGVENSDMERITALKPDIVKFDAQWITQLMDSQPGIALLAVMVKEFTSSGIRTVFEGIEERWQLEIAEQSGVHMVQGFALGRPELAPTSFSAFATGGKNKPPADGPSTRQPQARKGNSETKPTRHRASVARTFGRRKSP